MAEFRVPFSGQILNGVIYVSEPGSLKSTAAPSGSAKTQILTNDANNVPSWASISDVVANAVTHLANAREIKIGNQSNWFDGSANITYTLSEIGAVAKAGDTMTGSLPFGDSNIGIRRTGRSVSWVKGREGALIATTTVSGYSPIISTKTKDGSWDIGAYDSSSYTNELIFTYITDTHYNSDTNTTTAQIRFLPNGHIKASLDGVATSALTANKLATGRTLITDLASTTAATFDGSANVELGVKGVLDPAHGGTGEDTLNGASNALINALTVGTSTPTLNDYYVAQYAGGGTTTITYHRRPLSALYTLFKTQMADNGTASQAKKLSTARKINGTDFDGTSDITTEKWGTKRNITISDNDGTNTLTTNDIDGSANFTLKLPANIKATFTGNLTGNVTGNLTGIADSAKKWSSARNFTICGVTKSVDGTANVEWTAAEMGLSLNTHTHYYLTTIGDQRSTATIPNDYNNKFSFMGLKTKAIMNNPSDNTYSYVIGLRGWGDSSGGKAHELAFNDSGIYIRTGSTTTWDSWYRIVTVPSTSVTVGSSSKPVYVSNGVVTAFSSSIGSTTEPVYINAGTITKISYSINATIKAGTANRMSYYSGTNEISAATSIYATTDALAINSTSAPANSGKFQVIGTSTMQDILVSTTNTYTLGNSTYRWKAVYIGTADSYGSSSKPIYWSNGVPTAFSTTIGSTTQFVYINAGTITKTTETVGSIYNPVYMNAGVITELSGLIQKKTFTINNNANNVVLSHAAYTAATIVIQIVITSGERNLKAPINWASADGKVTLTTTQLTTGAVSGYIITARGVELS